MAEAPAEAFERLFRAEHAALVAFCFRRVDDYELAKDLTAETFRIAWSRWSEPRRSDRAWLFGVARNLIGNEYTRRTVGRPLALPEAEGADLADGRSRSAFDAVEVQATLARLAPAHQDVLRLSYWDGLTAAQTAEVLGTTAPAVWVRLSRARRAFAAAWDGTASNPAPTRTRTAP